MFEVFLENHGDDVVEHLTVQAVMCCDANGALLECPATLLTMFLSVATVKCVKMVLHLFCTLSSNFFLKNVEASSNSLSRSPNSSKWSETCREGGSGDHSALEGTARRCPTRRSMP